MAIVSLPRLLGSIFSLFALGALWVPPLVAQTVILPVVNSSFESPTPTTFPDYTIGATGWTLTRNDINAGTFAPTGGVTPSPIDGNQVGYANGFGGLQQTLGATFVGGYYYSFSAYIGYRSDEVNALVGDGQITLGTFDGAFHPLASLTATPGLGQFQLVSGTYRATPGDENQTIAIQLTSISNVQVVFDVVQVTSTVPEPASIAFVLGAAVLATAARLRHSRRATVLAR